MGGFLYGGWNYPLKNFEIISSINSDTKFTIILPVLDTWITNTSLPIYANIDFVLKIFSIEDLEIDFPNQPSSQHGALLNLGLKEVDTKYYGVLDPDNYILLENAFDLMINKMINEDLATLGVSYPEKLPKTYYWDFPTAYFQIFNNDWIKPSELNFMPDESSYIIDPSHPGGAGVASTRFLMPRTKFGKNLKKRLVRLYMKLSPRSTFINLINIITFRIGSIGKPLFRDTGWINRSNFSNLRNYVIPFAVNWPSVPQFAMSQKSYREVNADAIGSNINLTAHFFLHGIFENRDLGKRNIIYSWLRKFIFKDLGHYQLFPISNLVELPKYVFALLESSNMGNFRNAFIYSYNNEVFSIHLGHSGKSDPVLDQLRLDYFLRGLKSK